jgi:hypothetical protein
LLLLGQARRALGFAGLLALRLDARLLGQALFALARAKLGLALFGVGALGYRQRSRYLDVDVGLSDGEQIIGEGVDEAVEEPLNV